MALESPNHSEEESSSYDRMELESPDHSEEESISYDCISSIPFDALQSIDAIIVLGGGVPISPKLPPPFVQNRCEAAKSVIDSLIAGYERADRNMSDNADGSNQKKHISLPSILCLSAGTAHLPQLMAKHNGLPIWESTASACYLFELFSKDPCTFEHYAAEKKIFVETSSYDTISNAYFARTVHTDQCGWRNLLIITSEFHMDRSKAIFDWIFSIDGRHGFSDEYLLCYLSTPNAGLTPEAVASRKEREANSAANVRVRLSKTYTTMFSVWEFLTQKHDLYNALTLTQRSVQPQSDADACGDNSSQLLKQSYGNCTSNNGASNHLNPSKSSDGIPTVETESEAPEGKSEVEKKQIDMHQPALQTWALLFLASAISFAVGRRRI
eukprot:CAMPEP_0194328174 /NCGR_PEP_ID=MMETSP0171-20130528/43783_1 /TAXON_ID=218684 /ORGANISM="Corethron pennatum, Strain L29A3" /LENGTH=383 /DNA_ID=CAMNT_0039088413 /DNA_START=72 /DNA_END=1223 /DNA_ORIENTATION=-